MKLGYLIAFSNVPAYGQIIIIIADQNSTDGSREIALNYAKVTLIDNLFQTSEKNENLLS